MRNEWDQKKPTVFGDLTQILVQIKKLSSFHFHSKSKNSRVYTLTLSKANPKTLEVTTKKHVFHESFSICAPNSAHRAAAPPKNRLDNYGVRIYNDSSPFRPGAITNPSFNETYLSFELFFVFATFIVCFIYLRCYFHSRDESHVQLLLFSFICWASLFYGVFVFMSLHACVRFAFVSVCQL